MEDHRAAACLSANDDPTMASLPSLEEIAAPLSSKPAVATYAAADSTVPLVEYPSGKMGVAAGSTAGLHCCRFGVTGVDTSSCLDVLGEEPVPKPRSSTGRTLERKAAWEVRASSLSICLESKEKHAPGA